MTVIERAKTDTIKFIDGVPHWGSDNTPIPIEDLKLTVETIKSNRLIKRAVDEYNVDSLEQIRKDSIATILNNSSQDIENMNYEELVDFKKLQDDFLDIDTVYKKLEKSEIIDINAEKRASVEYLDSKIDKLKVKEPFVPQDYSWFDFSSLQEALGSLDRPWIQDQLYEDKSEKMEDVKDTIADFVNQIGLGYSTGQAAGEGLINLSNFLDWLPRQANDRVQELFWNKLLGATGWQGGFGQTEKADKTVPMEVLGMDFEMDPNSLLYKFFTLDE